MGALSAKAPHLDGWPLPLWMTFAAAELGQKEVPGKGSNPRILEYRNISKLNLAGDDSDVPWCAIFVNAALASAGVKTSGSAMARSFAASKDFEKLMAPMPGCITVFSSSRGPASGHVNFYLGETVGAFLGLGGNQGDRVSADLFPKARLVGHYWPKAAPKPPPPFNKRAPLAIKQAAGGKTVSDA